MLVFTRRFTKGKPKHKLALAHHGCTRARFAYYPHVSRHHVARRRPVSQQRQKDHGRKLQRRLTGRRQRDDVFSFRSTLWRHAGRISRPLGAAHPDQKIVATQVVPKFRYRHEDELAPLYSRLCRAQLTPLSQTKPTKESPTQFGLFFWLCAWPSGRDKLLQRRS